MFPKTNRALTDNSGDYNYAEKFNVVCPVNQVVTGIICTFSSISGYLTYYYIDVGSNQDTGPVASFSQLYVLRNNVEYKFNSVPSPNLVQFNNGQSFTIQTPLVNIPLVNGDQIMYRINSTPTAAFGHGTNLVLFFTGYNS